MKKIILFSIITISFANITAQDLPSNLAAKPTTIEKKNEIGINTTPVFKVLFGATQSDVNRFSLTYKRALNSKSALRISAIVDFVNMNYYNQIVWNDTIFQNGVTGMTKQKDSYSDYTQPHLNIGYERRFGKNKMRFFYGTDLILGYYQKNYSRENVALVSDTTGGSIHWIDKGGLQTMTLSRKSIVYFTGLNSFFGAKYSISKRFSISAQVGFDMTYTKENVVEKDQYANKRTLHYSSFDFSEQAGIINDVSLVYKF